MKLSTISLICLLSALSTNSAYSQTSLLSKIFSNNEKANIIKCKSDISTIGSSLELFKLDNFTYPTTKEGLQALVTNPAPQKYENWSQLLEKIPQDPWGTEYKLINPGVHDEIDIVPYGPDGKQATDDDIGSWQIDH